MPRLPQQHNGGRAREREAAGATVRPQRIAPSYFLHQHLLVHLLKQMDIAFTVLFFIEMSTKIIALGFAWS